jgi:hypothetical protein
VEEEKIEVSYSTLTRLVRELGLGKPREDPLRSRAGRAGRGDAARHDGLPGEAGGPARAVIASLLYLRYSKRRYLKFYRVFNRFAMKCFLHEALMFWGYAAKLCIIDNTNLARLRGSGKQAVIVPEMAAFAERYGFSSSATRSATQSKSRRGTEFLDGRDQLPARPHLREPGGL